MNKLLSVVLCGLVLSMFAYAQEEKPAKSDAKAADGAVVTKSKKDEMKPAAAAKATKMKKEMKMDCCAGDKDKKECAGKNCCEDCCMKGDKAKMHHQKQDVKPEAKPDVKPEVKPDSKPLN